MKAFDLAAVRKGAKVCTRDGRAVRILSTDLQNTERPVCAAVTKRKGNETYEIAQQYLPNGLLCVRTSIKDGKKFVEERDDDLMLED